MSFAQYPYRVVKIDRKQPGTYGEYKDEMEFRKYHGNVWIIGETCVRFLFHKNNLLCADEDSGLLLFGIYRGYYNTLRNSTQILHQVLIEWRYEKRAATNPSIHTLKMLRIITPCLERRMNVVIDPLLAQQQHSLSSQNQIACSSFPDSASPLSSSSLLPTSSSTSTPRYTIIECAMHNRRHQCHQNLIKGFINPHDYHFMIHYNPMEFQIRHSFLHYNGQRGTSLRLIPSIRREDTKYHQLIVLHQYEMKYGGPIVMCEFIRYCYTTSQLSYNEDGFRVMNRTFAIEIRCSFASTTHKRAVAYQICPSTWFTQHQDRKISYPPFLQARHHHRPPDNHHYYLEDSNGNGKYKNYPTSIRKLLHSTNLVSSDPVLVESRLDVNHEAPPDKTLTCVLPDHDVIKTTPSPHENPETKGNTSMRGNVYRHLNPDFLNLLTKAKCESQYTRVFKNFNVHSIDALVRFIKNESMKFNILVPKRVKKRLWNLLKIRSCDVVPLK